MGQDFHLFFAGPPPAAAYHSPEVAALEVLRKATAEGCVTLLQIGCWMAAKAVEINKPTADNSSSGHFGAAALIFELAAGDP